VVGAAPRRLVGLTVYSCEPDEADAFAALGTLLGVVATTTTEPPSETSAIAVPANRCISVAHTSELPASTLRALHEVGVRHISTRSIGLDHIDLRAAAELGIVVEHVVYAPDGVADFTLMLILMAVRGAAGIVPSATEDGRPWRVRGRDLHDLTVGVVGAGRIGSAVIQRLRGFGCRVLVHSTGRTPSSAAARAELVSLDAVLVESDVVTLHLPLVPATHHLIGRDQLARMKPGSILVNTARGALVDTGALVDALERGHLGGAALDVLEGEERFVGPGRPAPPVDDRLLLRLRRLPNAIVTPHTAYRTERALHETVEGALTACLRFEGNRADDAEARRRDPVRRLLGGT
jgi:D-specific alpha-keto acid dehydrogenase